MRTGVSPRTMVRVVVLALLSTFACGCADQGMIDVSAETLAMMSDTCRLDAIKSAGRDSSGNGTAVDVDVSTYDRRFHDCMTSNGHKVPDGIH